MKLIKAGIFLALTGFAVVAGGLFTATPASATSITGLSVISTNSSGGETGNVWSTVGPDTSGYYNSYIAAGAISNTPSLGTINCCNNSSTTPNISLTPGTYTYSFYDEGFTTQSYYSLSLFFGGNTNTPGISVLGALNSSSFSANGSTAGAINVNTTEAFTTASGTLSYNDGTNTVTLTGYSLESPTTYNRDVVGATSTGGDGTADYAGQFTLTVTPDCATAYCISNAAVDDLGTATLQTAPTPSTPAAGGSFTASQFPLNKYSGPDSDGGCDGDAFANFDGSHAAAAASGLYSGAVPTTCGDTALIQWAGGSIGDTATTLTTADGGAGNNGTGLEFHVEDSDGSGTGCSPCFIPETLTIGGNSAVFDVPFTIDRGNAGDSFSIPEGDITVNVGGTNYFVIYNGTSVLGSATSNDDEGAFETNLVGCVSTVNSGLGSCGSGTTSSVSSFTADDPPVDAPEPSSLAILGVALAALTGVRLRKAARS